MFCHIFAGNLIIDEGIYVDSVDNVVSLGFGLVSLFLDTCHLVGGLNPSEKY